MVRLSLIINIIILVFCGIVNAATTTSLSQFGVTWTFQSAVEYGQFCNGDYWVIDQGSGIIVTAISPAYTILGDGRKINGSMIDPYGIDSLNGWDSGYQGSTSGYSDDKNIAKSLPYTLTANHTLASAVSNNPAPNLPDGIVKSVALLTCLSSAPASGSFRPPYGESGSKTIYANVSNINWDKLKTLPLISGTPDIDAYTTMFSVNNMLAGRLWTIRYPTPTDWVDNYYYTDEIGNVALLLNMDFTHAEKLPLLIQYLQFGLDLYGTIKQNGFGYQSAAGIGWARKLPIMLAGEILGISEIHNIWSRCGDYLNSDGYGPGTTANQLNPPDMIHLPEDDLFFYVTQDDIDRTHSDLWTQYVDTRGGTPYPYTSEYIGMPEWGVRHAENPYQDQLSWYASYRQIENGVRASWATALVVYEMGLKTLWNHDVFFDYLDRAWGIYNNGIDPCGFNVPGQVAKALSRDYSWMRDMWILYRGQFGPLCQGMTAPEPEPEPQTGSGCFVGATGTPITFGASGNSIGFRAQATSNTYYVAKSGSNSNAGTESLPWLTIQYAIDHGLSPGDTIYVKSGTYNERIHLAGTNGTEGNSGDASGYITIASYPGDTVTIDGTGFTWGSSFNSGFYSSAPTRCMNYIELKGFEIQNFPEAGITFWENTDEAISPQTSDGSHHIKLTNLNIHNNTLDGIIISGGAVIQSSNIIIDGVTSSYNGGHGIKFNGDDAGTTNRRHIHDSEIKNCIAHHNGTGSGDGIGIYSSTGNYNINMTYNNSYSNAREGIASNENSYVLVDHNTSTTNGTRVDDSDDHGIAVWSSDHVTVSNNTITNNPGYGLQIYDSPQASIFVCNNTITGNTLGSIDGSYSACP